jgi:hypothetical protein
MDTVAVFVTVRHGGWCVHVRQIGSHSVPNRGTESQLADLGELVGQVRGAGDVQAGGQQPDRHDADKGDGQAGRRAVLLLQAPLQGGGPVTSEIAVNGKVIGKGIATGGYNIAMAKISKCPLTGRWSDTDAD